MGTLRCCLLQQLLMLALSSWTIHHTQAIGIAAFPGGFDFSNSSTASDGTDDLDTGGARITTVQDGITSEIEDGVTSIFRSDCDAFTTPPSKGVNDIIYCTSTVDGIASTSLYTPGVVSALTTEGPIVTGDFSTRDCIPVTSGQTLYTYDLRPNTTTVTITVTPGVSVDVPPPPPPVTQPTYCDIETLGGSASFTTVVVTNKVAPTVYTTYSQAGFVATRTPAPPARATASPVSDDSDTSTVGGFYVSDGQAETQESAVSRASVGPATNPGDPSRSTMISNVPIEASAGGLVVGDSTFTGALPSSSVISVSGQAITVQPSQVVGAGTTLSLSFASASVPPRAGDSPVASTLDITRPAAPAATVSSTLGGVAVEVGSTRAVLSGQTFNIASTAPNSVVEVGGKSITVGSGGVTVSGSSITPQTPTATFVLGAQAITAQGSSVVVVSGSTYTYGANVPAQTIGINGQSVTIASNGIQVGSSTIRGAGSTGTAIQWVGGVTLTAMGNSTAVLDGTTFRVGPGASATTALVGNNAVTVGPNGIVANGTTIAYPFNAATQLFTAGRVTFTQVGSTLAVLDGTTFTFGSAVRTTTTKVIDGQTVRIGPQGVTFTSTTFTAAASDGLAQATTTAKRKNHAVRQRGSAVWACSLIGMAMLRAVI